MDPNPRLFGGTQGIIAYSTIDVNVHDTGARPHVPVQEIRE